MSAEIIDFPVRPRTIREILEAAGRPPVPGEDSNMAILRAILSQAVPRKPRGGPPEPEPPSAA